jgi:hypothetical protein
MSGRGELFHNGRETHRRGVWVEGMVEGQMTSRLVAAGPWGVMTSHQSPCSESRLRQGRCFMALQVLAPGMPQVVSQEFDHERLFWGEIRRPLLLRKSLKYETLHTVEVVGFGETLQEPYDRVFISEIIIFADAKHVPIAYSLGKGVIHWCRLLLILSNVPSSSLRSVCQMA